MTESSKPQRQFRRKVVGFLERHTIQFYVATAVMYALMIPLTIYVFPSTTLMLTIVVLVTGLTGAIASLASTLIDLHQNEEIDDLQDDVDEINE